jgi:DNA polymerase III delta prime subunit
MRSEPRARWDDLILPEPQKKVLRSALAELDVRRRANSSAGSEHAPHRPGLTLLFAGEPGTGKTLAATLLADEFGERLVNVDLLGLSSQDTHEAANEIERAFDEAERSHALLVFNRADLLLETPSPAVRARPKRSRERRMFPSLSKLAERSHGQPGAVVFESRLTPSLAPSLAQDMDFVVEFPLPWSDARGEIWRRQLPADARVSDDDLNYLAVSFRDSGATIRDCCVAATAMAAKDGTHVQTVHIARALASQYRKRLLGPQASSALAHLLEVSAAGSPASGPGDHGRSAAPARPPKPIPGAPEPRRTPAKAVPAPAAPKAVAAAAAGAAAVEAAAGKPALEPAPGKPTLAPAPGKPAVEPAPSKPAVRLTPRKPAARPAPSEPGVRLTPGKPAAKPAPPPSEGLQARIEAALGHAPPAPATPAPAPPASATPAPATAKLRSGPTRSGPAAAKPLSVPGEPATERPTLARAQPAFVAAPAPARAKVQRRPARISGRLAALALICIFVAAALGFAVARLTGGNAAPAAPDRQASAGPVQISFPSSWQRQDVPRAEARGLVGGLAVGPATPGRGLLVIGTSRADRVDQLSQALRVALSDTSPANAVTLGGLNYNVYQSPTAHDRSAGSVYALPTTAGTVFGVCLTSGAPSGFNQSCQRVLATLRLTSGRILPPGQSETYASALNRALSKLNAARSKAASQLRVASSARAQAAAASDLAAAHTAAASTLSQLRTAGPAAPANSAVVAALRANASAYAALARAAVNNNAAGYSRASGAVSRATNSLQSALARLGSLGYQVG